ncbi:MAG: acetate--CoA ligase family protein [Pseudomonadota bacterium]|nr:acetate--CoA ligase family protein [Pseudomonadota bacterium]
MKNALRALFWPQSIALVGASPDARIIRGRIVEAILEHAFPGPIYPVSRTHAEIRGLQCYRSVAELPQVVDLAIITIPAAHVVAALEACAEKGIPAAIVISSGFAEERSDAGAARQRAISTVAARHGMAVMGPNAEGFLNAQMPLAATFSPTVLRVDGGLHPAGSCCAGITVISQSGGVGFSFFNRGRPKGLNFSFVVTTGNEASLDALDVLAHLVEDNATQVILMFVEGFNRPQRLSDIASAAARRRKPLIIAKVGRSSAAAAAAASHTASLAGSHQAYQAVFERYGIINGIDSDQMTDVAAGFGYFYRNLPRGYRVGILTPSGGAGAWLADQCEAHGLSVPELDPHTRAMIDAELPAYGSSRNPVDVTAQVIFKLGYAPVLQMMETSPSIDAILVAGSLAHPTYIERDLEALMRLGSVIEKPIVFCAYTRAHPRAVELLAKAGFPCLENMSNAAYAIKAMADYAAFLESFEPHQEPPLITQPAGGTLDSAIAVYTEHQAKEALTNSGIACPTGVLVTSASAAAAAAAQFATPVTLKVQSVEIPHKTEAGGVALALTGDAAVASAYTEMMARVQADNPARPIDGVRVEPMAGAGSELIVGIHRDHDFGLLLSIGSGGVLVEVLNDLVTTPLPVNRKQASSLVSRLRGAALLEGVRGQAAGDIDALLNLLVALSHFALANAAVLEALDLNPVIVHPKNQGVTIADAVIVTRVCEVPS